MATPSVVYLPPADTVKDKVPPIQRWPSQVSVKLMHSRGLLQLQLLGRLKWLVM